MNSLDNPSEIELENYFTREGNIQGGSPNSHTGKSKMSNNIKHLGLPRSVSIYSILYYIHSYINYIGFNKGVLKYILNRKQQESQQQISPH